MYCIFDQINAQEVYFKNIQTILKKQQTFEWQFILYMMYIIDYNNKTK